MTNKQLCSYCTEYDKEHKCDVKDKCPLLNLLRENRRLKKKVKEMEDAEIAASWDRNPDRMGW